MLIGGGKLLTVLVRIPGSRRQPVMAMLALKLSSRNDRGASENESMHMTKLHSTSSTLRFEKNS